MKLKDKVAIVTGGGSGIGRAISICFAQEGANVSIADINIEGAQITAREIEKLGRNALAIRTDVASTSDVARMVESTANELGRIDILINNAGIRYATPLLEISEEEWRRQIDVNLNAVFFCTKAAAPYMIKQGGGKIVSISSAAGYMGILNRAAYCAAKAAVINLTRQMALELCRYNIQVNAIAPGFTRTPLTDIYRDPSTPDAKALAEYLKTTPAGRWAEPEEMASAALFLCSKEADFITGTTLDVDGGMMAGTVPASMERMARKGISK